MEYAIAGITGVFLFIYLMYALLRRSAFEAWGNRPAVRRPPRSGVPKLSGRWARR